MNTHIQIRNVPEGLHRKLKIRAAEKDMTLTDYVKEILESEVDMPTLAELAQRMKKLPPVKTSESSADIIRKDRDTR
jgi:antitoxin FitA